MLRRSERIAAQNVPSDSDSWDLQSSSNQDFDSDSQSLSDTSSEIETLEVMVATAEVFETNPFSGNINPTSSNGLKLYQAGTADRDDSDLLTLKIVKSEQFIDAMKTDATKFSWGKLIATIEETVDGTTVKRAILTDFKDLKVEKVRVHMNKVFESKTPSTTVPTGSLKMFEIDPAANDDDKKTFYLRVRANMIGLRILGSLDKASLKTLKTKENLTFGKMMLEKSSITDQLCCRFVWKK